MPGKKSDFIRIADNEAKVILQRNIKLLRKEHGLTQQMVADALNIKRETYCNYENRTLPPHFLIISLAKIYNVSPDTFYKSDLKTDILYVKTKSGFFDDEHFDELTDSEKSLIMKYRQLSKSEKVEISELIEKKLNTYK